MTHMLWSQDFFAKGELSPLMYSRVTLQAYYQGLKRAKNVICYPQGTAGKRFGTTFLFKLAETNYLHVFFKSFQYLNECCYLIVIRPLFVDIYLEGFLQASVASPITADEIQLIDYTTLENRFRITTGIYKPKDLLRDDLGSGNTANITGFTATTLQITGPFGVFPTVYPARFTAVAMPTTTPQIHAGRTYFIRPISGTEFKLYGTAQDAAADINSYAIASAGTTAVLRMQIHWTFPDVVFSELPQFDFDGGYDTSAFTPGATSGYGITITRTSGAFNFTAKFVGGSFRGNNGICRITAVNGTNQATVDIVQSFSSTAAIPGKLCLITENAWSDIRGWPRKCSSFQNRAFFANTDTLTNGLWGSVTNEFDNFDDLIDADDDSAISWLPTSDSVNYIQFIVPYRSLTIHTNSGVYSTPLSIETAITPSNFSLSLQDSTPADVVRPQGIDNQIIVLSGNDAHSLLWDGFNNAYTSNIISIANEQLIRFPTDEAPYVDKQRAGSRYMFIINADGTLAIYQSLISENVSGFTQAVTEQNYGNSYFRWVTSNFDGRAWFVVEREVAETGTGPFAISTYTPTPPDTGTEIFTSATHGLLVDVVTAATFATTGTLMTTTPQIAINTTYWVIGLTTTTFYVYPTKEDADADTNRIIANLIPSNNTFKPFALHTALFVEQLDFDAQMDCTGYYPLPTTTIPTPETSTITGVPRFNGQFIYMQGDGFGFQTTGIDSTINFVAHGSEVEIVDAQYGFPIDVEITPLPISISLTGHPKSSNLINPQHIRFATMLFADTIGGSITQGNRTFPIALKKLSDIIPGEPPVPTTGPFEISVLNAWNDFTMDNFTINHSEPFGFKLTGIFYKIDV